MAATISIKVSALRKSCGLKRAVGTVSGFGRTLDGVEIYEIEFAQNQIVRYYGADGKAFAVFQDTAYLDD